MTTRRLPEAWRGLQRYFAYYNRERPHQSLGYLTPDASLFSAEAVGALVGIPVP